MGDITNPVLTAELSFGSLMLKGASYWYFIFPFIVPATVIVGLQIVFIYSGNELDMSYLAFLIIPLILLGVFFILTCWFLLPTCDCQDAAFGKMLPLHNIFTNNMVIFLCVTLIGMFNEAHHSIKIIQQFAHDNLMECGVGNFTAMVYEGPLEDGEGITGGVLAGIISGVVVTLLLGCCVQVKNDLPDSLLCLTILRTPFIFVSMIPIFIASMFSSPYQLVSHDGCLYLPVTNNGTYDDIVTYAVDEGYISNKTVMAVIITSIILAVVFVSFYLSYAEAKIVVHYTLNPLVYEISTCTVSGSARGNMNIQVTKGPLDNWKIKYAKVTIKR